jgi:class 3 adenylate cyclase/CHASE2 domain-containing sensor protein
MTRIQRRLLIDTSVIGLTITLFVVVLDYSSRILAPLDDWFYDRRARLCQYFTPKPTDKLVHVDIDDASLEAIGQWPWPRSDLAEIIDEIERAGPKMIATDIVFVDPSKANFQELPGGKTRKIDDDAIFAAAIARGGNILVPTSFELPKPLPAVYRKLRDYLTGDLELSEADCFQRLLADPDKALVAGSKFPTDMFVRARREAMNARITREIDEHPTLTLEEARNRLLPKTDPTVTGSPRFNTLSDEYRRVQAAVPQNRFSLPISADLPPLARFESEQAPIPQLSRVAAAGGFVDYLQKDEGNVIRSMPLYVDYRGHLFPQMDLALACAVLNVDLHTIKLLPDRIIIPKPPGRDRDIVIPVRTKYSATFGHDVGMIFDIPVRGRSDWETIYDDKNYAKPELHIPIPFIWEARTIRQRIARNNSSIDKAISMILDDDAPWKLAQDPDNAKVYAKKLPPLEDTAARQKLVESTRKLIKEAELEPLAKMTDDELKNDPVKIRQRMEFIDANNALAAFEQNKRFEEILTERRNQLRDKISGRAVLIGWVASGGIDAYPTSIQTSCPGVVIHGMIFNSIMTGEFWRHSPSWVTALITIFIGVLVTAANAFLRPSYALITAVLIGTGYLLINGLLLFDYGNLCVGVAAPMVALASVWSTGALAGLLIEAAERARITKRFSSYVDQKLVDHVIENPDAVLDGQVREMSVIFTDLAGFTSLSEQLRERTVPILSEYLGLMVPVIRKNNGFVNKFLGDGIMCFYNAPEDDPEHAVHAVQTVLEMQAVMKVFAGQMTERGLPHVSMRCGVSTGQMVVGDSGPADASDYTVLGDAVNFASRLEGANKATGTKVLISQRTSEMLGDKFLLRPVGKLQVLGKTEGVMTYEPLAPIDDATLEDRLCAASSAEMIAAFIARDFARCIQAADQMEKQFGLSNLPSLYRKTAQEFLANPPDDDFAGSLVLTEK